MAEFEPSNPNDLKRMRSAAAGMIKDLVAARLIDDEEWSERESVRQTWFRTTKVPEKRSVVYLLKQAARRFRKFSSEFGGALDSVPFESDTSSTPQIEELRDLLCRFVDHEELSSLADQRNRDKRTTRWEDIARWEFLNPICALLDEFPDMSNLDFDTEPPDIVYYGSKKFIGCPPRAWKLLNYLLAQRNNKCSFAELAEPIWGDRNKRVNTAGVHDVNSRANAWLEKHSIPYRLSASKDGGVNLKKIDSDSVT